MRRSVGIIFMCLGALMMISAIALLFYNYSEDKSAGAQSEEHLNNVVTYIDEVKSVDTNGVQDVYDDLFDNEMAVVEINNYNYIGYLTIPSLALELPVMADCDYSLMRVAPCRYSGSYKTDNLVIAAHNYNRHFGNISDLQPGEIIYFTDMEGYTYSYSLACIEILQPEQVAEMVESDWALTLYTCTYSGSERVTLRFVKE